MNASMARLVLSVLIALLAAAFDPADCEVTATLADSPAGDAITVSVNTDYEALVGLLPTPAQLAAQTTMRLEDQ